MSSYRRLYSVDGGPFGLRAIEREEHFIKVMQDKLTRATSPLKRHRYNMRLKNAKVRLLALKLAS